MFRWFFGFPNSLFAVMVNGVFCHNYWSFVYFVFLGFLGLLDVLHTNYPCSQISNISKIDASVATQRFDFFMEDYF